MAPTTRLSMCSRLATILVVGCFFHSAHAQQKCYYPNGKEAPEKPCSSVAGSACCPADWQCLDNGLCYYEPNKLWGTYSCTDNTWKAEGCPSNLCTYKLNRVGGESMKQCSNHNNQWCCNGDDTNVKCCNEWPQARPFFSLKSGSAYATAGGKPADQAPILNNIIGEATSGDASGVPSSTRSPSSSTRDASSASTTPTGPTTPMTSLQTSLSTASTGVVTLIVTSIIQPPAASATQGLAPVNSSKSNLPLIIGCAVGIPLGLAFIAVLFWLFRKRSQQKKALAHDHDSSLESPKPYSNSVANGSADLPSFAGGAKMSTTYKSEAGVPELAGQSVGPARPVSTVKGHAELESGSGFAPGAAAPHAPHLVGVGGGTGASGQTPMSSWGSAPPGYSPGQNQASWGQPHPQGLAEADGTPIAAQTTVGGRYIPYRPPQAQQQGNVLGDVPEMAEMSAVTTPPELSAVQTPPELSAVQTPPELSATKTPPARR